MRRYSRGRYILSLASMRAVPNFVTSGSRRVYAGPALLFLDIKARPPPFHASRKAPPPLLKPSCHCQLAIPRPTISSARFAFSNSPAKFPPKPERERKPQAGKAINQGMATLATAATLLTTLSTLLLLLRAGTCAADDYSAFVYAGCSQGHYDASSPYASAVDSVLTSVANSAPYSPYANFTAPSDASMVGLYQCRSDLPSSICGGCVRSAISRLSTLCAWSAGGGVQLRACFVRYGNDSFLGKQDTAVLFKKCGGTPGDAGGVAMRDSALGALVAAAAPEGGGYRAGGSGGVQAMSQCVGDLGAKACSDCVSAAAAQLKAGCGYATAGEVYLGKCYARFWANGGGGFSSSSAGRHGFGLVHNAFAACFLASLAYVSLAV
ncbi:hypothetical protein HU200_017481 [Digitaria exilis]|uniref:Gnk2-homologous domain-containing protein n=1 Tax=Digitaria exilis TaxID=1010633 RepID=A0A835F6J7_9POAL|nr:hypothetical protein HU200_017481 [Digitaria exilis]